MTIKTDAHIHSTFSADGHDTPETIIQKAISLGLSAICFTEHNDFDLIPEPGLSFELNVPPYLAEIKRLKTIYSEQIKVLHGLEIGLEPNLAERNKNLIESYDFDFVIGSSHVINKIDPSYPQFWQNITSEEGVTLYFEAILNCLNTSNDFDSYGHLDYVIRYAPDKGANFSYAKYKDIIDTILTTIISKGKIIEVNSAGIRYGLKAPNPNWDILKRYKELGGEAVTIGSDSHYAQDLSKDFDLIEQGLLNLGFKYYVFFEQRKPNFIKL